MSFQYNLADTGYKTSVFYQSGYWIKPQGITMISITAIGAGGGGAIGTTNTSGNTRSGGGGGGSGGITRLTIPEMFITDSLIINIGTGGAGGLSGPGNGERGGDTSVDQPVPGNGDIYTNVINASGGTGAVGATGGVGATAAAVGNSLYSNLGIWMALGGQGGGIGNTFDGVSVIYGVTGLPITGGAGGGGVDESVPYFGGSITGAGFVPTNPGDVGGSGGNKGVFSLTPFYSTGGSGGRGMIFGSSVGGNGNIGSGGGGGGGAEFPGTGGTGGQGGDGLVIIQCW